MTSTRRVDVVDTYHGQSVADPYRWLEDQESEEVRAWWQAQNAATRTHLDAIPIRKRVAERLETLLALPRVSTPVVRAGTSFTLRNPGTDAQSSLWADERLLLDPVAEAGGDETASVMSFSPSPDGRLVAWAGQSSGTDWSTMRVRDVTSGQDLADEVPWVKMPSAAWLPDSSGFFHCGLPAPADDAVHTAANPAPRVSRRTIGGAEELVLEVPDCAWLVPHVTEDGRWLVVEGYVGPFPRKLFIRPADLSSDWRVLLEGSDVTRFVGVLGGRIVLQQHEGHVAGRIVTVDPHDPQDVQELLAEDPALPLSAFGASDVVAGVLVTLRTDIDAHQIRITDADGESYDLAMPQRGCLTPASTGIGVEASADGGGIVFGLASAITPATTYLHDLGSRETTVLWQPPSGYVATEYAVERDWATGKDGVRIPLTVYRRHDTPRDGNRPALVTAYGGFGITLGITGFMPWLVPWLDEGGVAVIAGVRGGGEFGEQWHAAGSLLHKQNTFDDVVASGAALVTAGWTRPELTVFTGGSNGGLTAAAVLTQVPDAFAAVVPQVPVTDMLRMGQFTLGATFTTEYGDIADPEEFRTIHDYSPLHRVVDGTPYPATMVMCGEYDERCPPGVHSYKMTAALQRAQAGTAPVLLRVAEASGHGHGKARTVQAEEYADLLAFLLDAVGHGA